MALTKRVYKDGETPITAQNLNDIQDEIIRHGNDQENPHGMTAEKIGARPDTWMPTAADVGAAPSGYGLGRLTNYPVANDTEVDNKLIEVINSLGEHTFKRIVLSFTTVENFTKAGGHYYVDIYKLSTNYAMITIKSYIVGGREMQRIWYEGKLQPWEWVNPPMTLGVEYRTTERDNGKVVYAKKIDFGALPNSTYKYVNHGATLTKCIRYNIVNKYSSIMLTGHRNVITEIDANVVQIATNADLSAHQAWATIYYTKD